MSNKELEEKGPDITDYDKRDYDYEAFWRGREYEHQSEVLALNRLLKDETGDWILDLGGSYGRLLDTYAKKYLNCIVLDYSLESLKKGRRRLRDTKATKNIYFVAANAYFLPFREGVIDSVLMVRVMHHLEEPERAIKEIARILKQKGGLFLEFANKRHLLAIFRFLLRLQLLEIFRKDPYEQPRRESKQGINSEDRSIFLNFHPGKIRESIEEQGLNLERSVSVSNLRIPIVKKFMSLRVLLFLEGVAQRLLSWLGLGPSIFLKARKEGEVGESQLSGRTKIDALLCCPACKAKLSKTNHGFACQGCELEFQVRDGIYDFRYPRSLD